MNVENATSEEAVSVDDDLVAALGFEPADDILIVDDPLNDELSIVTDDDIKVTTGPSTEATSKTKDAGSKTEAKAEAVAKTKKKDAKKPAEAKKSDAGKPEAKKTDSKSKKADSKSKTEAQKSEAKKSAAQRTGVKDAESTKADSKKADSKEDVKPPPPTSADAVLLSSNTETYGLKDVQLPNFRSAFARFIRQDESEAAALTLETGAAPLKPADAKELLADAPTKVPTIPAGDDIEISLPSDGSAATVQAPPRYEEAPAEPNVYQVPTRTGRTRLRSRKVRRQIRHIDPWSVLTFSFVFHACLFGALLLASVLVWNFADGAGIVGNAETLWQGLSNNDSFEIDEGTLGRAAFMIAGLLTVASSVMLVLLAVFFNLISDLVGGVRVTVIEEEPVRVK